MEKRLQALQARLKELGVVPPTPAGPRAMVRPPVDLKGTITVTRVDAEGVIWSELWTDDRGQPGKLIKREEAGKMPAKLPGKVTREPTTDGKVRKAFEVEDGSVTEHVYDSATGKLIETRPGKPSNKKETPRNNLDPFSNPPATDDFRLPPPKSAGIPDLTPSINVAPPGGLPLLPPAEGAAPALSPANPPVPSATIDAVPTTRVPERSPASSGHRELDLVSLATSYADAVGNLETTQAKLADIEAVAKQSPNAVPKQEITSARLAVAAAQRKEQLLQRIAKVALDGVSKELDRGASSGLVPISDQEEAQTRMEILQQILSTQPGTQGDGGLKK